MRKILGLMLALFATPALAADPVEGMWMTAADDNGNSGQISITPCGDRFCGKLIKAFGPGGGEISSPNIGKLIIWDMVAEGGGKYGDGKIWSPDRDKTYSSKMTLQGDVLSVKGCVLIICRDGGEWHRVK